MSCVCARNEINLIQEEHLISISGAENERPDPSERRLKDGINVMRSQTDRVSCERVIRFFPSSGMICFRVPTQRRNIDVKELYSNLSRSLLAASLP